MKRLALIAATASIAIAGCGGTATKANKTQQVAKDLKHLMYAKEFETLSGVLCIHQNGNQYQCKVSRITGPNFTNNVWFDVTDDGQAIEAVRQP